MNGNNIHIAITYGRKLITELNGYEKFDRAFRKYLNRYDDAYWITSIGGIPSKYGDMIGRYCYIIAEGKVIYRASIAEFREGGYYEFDNGRSWFFKRKVMILTAPVVKAPEGIYMKGFQGFKYVEQLF